MPLDPGIPLGNLSAPLAVERLRRRTIATATGLSLVDPSDHTGAEIPTGTSHVVILALRRKVGAVPAVRPIDAAVSSSSANRTQWLLLHVPAALVPAGLVWTDLYAGAPVEWARVNAGGLPVALAPVLATMDCLASGSLAGLVTVQSDPCCDAQPLASGDALVVVGARSAAADGAALAIIRAEISDE